MTKPATRMSKGRNGWEAKTELPLDGITREDHTGTCPAILTISTMKTSRGGLVTSCSVAFRSGMFMSHRLYEDFSQRYTYAPNARCTEKAVATMQDQALADLALIEQAARDHYAGREQTAD